MTDKYPVGGLLAPGDGWLYGVTANGGANDEGTLYRLQPNGSSFSVLKSFPAAGNDGHNPLGGLALGADGMLYGTHLQRRLLQRRHRVPFGARWRRL